VKKISVSIVIYNNEINELKKTISSVLNTKLDIHLFLIDNSPKDSLRYIFNDSRIEYIFNNANIGFGAGHNIAIRKVMESGSKYHLVLNPDIFFNSGVLEKIIEYLDANQDVGLLMPKILYPDGSLQYLCKLLPTPADWIYRKFLPFKKYLENRNEIFELHFTNYDKIMNVPYLSGCFMFFRTDVLKEIGLFDTGIFMYGEDTDICRRIHKKYKTIYYPLVNVFHVFQKGSHKSIRLLWIHIKAAVYYFNKWGWFIDKERDKINISVLKELGYEK
jgi:GT2 family glycosyltransferase